MMGVRLALGVVEMCAPGFLLPACSVSAPLALSSLRERMGAVRGLLWQLLL